MKQDCKCLLMEEDPEPEGGSETGAVEAPTPVLLRQCTVLVVQEEGPSFPDEDFPVGCFEIPAADSSDPSSVAIVVVAELDHRLVVCVPYHSWHRILNKRVLPPRALAKPVLLELPCTDRADSDTEVASFKFWLGILAPEFEDYIVFDAALTLTISSSLTRPTRSQLLPPWWRLSIAILALLLPQVERELLRQHRCLGRRWTPVCKLWRNQLLRWLIA